MRLFRISRNWWRSTGPLHHQQVPACQTKYGGFFIILSCFDISMILLYNYLCIVAWKKSWLISELFFSNILNLKESEPLLNPKLFIFDPETNGFWGSSFQEIPSMTVLVVNLVWYSFNLFPLGIHANQLKLLSVCGVAFQLAPYWGSKHVHKIPGDHHFFLGWWLGLPHCTGSSDGSCCDVIPKLELWWDLRVQGQFWRLLHPPWLKGHEGSWMTLLVAFGYSNFSSEVSIFPSWTYDCSHWHQSS